MNTERAQEPGDVVLEWAHMSDTEFLFRYLDDMSEEDMAEFIKMFPEFLEEDS